MDLCWQSMSLIFNMLSRLVIVFLPRSKHLLISWLQSPSAVILGPKKIKSLTVFIVYPPICHEVIGPDAIIFVFWMLSFKLGFLLFSLHYFASVCCSCCLFASVVSDTATPRTAALQAPPSMGFSRQEYWSGLPLLVSEMSATVQYFEHSLALPFFGIGMKTDLFQSCGHC